jgi:hypothetical protein
MLLMLTVVLGAVALGYLAGGRLSGFENSKVRWWGLAPVGLAMQLAPVNSHDAALWMLLASYVVLLVFVARNFRASGFPLILIGLLLNFAVIAANSGMPVTKSALISSGQLDSLNVLVHGGGAKHHLAASGDPLIFLADVIPVGTPFHQAMSVGDALVFAGIVWFVVATMRRRRAGGGRASPATDPIPLEHPSDP